MIKLKSKKVFQSKLEQVKGAALLSCTFYFVSAFDSVQEKSRFYSTQITISNLP